MLDEKATKALMQTLQQALQILQSSAGGSDGDDDMEMDDDMDSSDDMNMDKDMNPNEGMDAQGMGDEDMDMEDDDDDTADMGDDMDMEDDEEDDGGDMKASLNDRIARLEQHTGLKKAATAGTLLERIDQLETHWLGEEYEGSAQDRVEQLESIVLNKSATDEDRHRGSGRVEESDESPDVIPLDDLIKTAIKEGITAGMQQLSKSAANEPDDELPSAQELRRNRKMSKSAKGIKYGDRKAQAHLVQTDADLQKAASNLGMGGDLDAPVSMGEALQMMYLAQSGSTGSYTVGDE